MGVAAQERIRATFMVLGAHCKEVDAQKFRELSIDTELLQGWAEVRPLQVKFPSSKGRIRAEASYVDHERVASDYDSTKYLIRTGFETSGDGREAFSITTRTTFTVRPSQYDTLRGLLSDPMMAVQQLLALATDYPVNVTKCVAALRIPKDGGGWELKSVEILFQPRLVRTQEERRHPYPKEFLFRRSDLDDLGRAMHAWQESRGELDSMFGLVFSERYGDGMLLDQRFSYLVQAIETYHRRRVGGEDIPPEDHQRRVQKVMAAAPDEYQEWLKARLRYGNEPSLRRRLKHVFGCFLRTTNDLIPRQGRFIQRALDTRNYFTHHDLRLKKKAARGEELYLMTEYLRAICSGILMMELGFTNQEADERIRRRRQHRPLKARLRKYFERKRGRQ